MGLNFELLDSGCCGMAGSFGFEAGHYDVSVAVGERVAAGGARGGGGHADHRRRLQLPRADRRPDRPALHLAQVLQMALHEGPQGVEGELPEREYEPLGKWEPAMTPGVVALALGAGRCWDSAWSARRGWPTVDVRAETGSGRG